MLTIDYSTESTGLGQWVSVLSDLSAQTQLGTIAATHMRVVTPLVYEAFKCFESDEYKKVTEQLNKLSKYKTYKRQRLERRRHALASAAFRELKSVVSGVEIIDVQSEDL